MTSSSDSDEEDSAFAAFRDIVRASVASLPPIGDCVFSPARARVAQSTGGGGDDTELLAVASLSVRAGGAPGLLRSRGSVLARRLLDRVRHRPRHGYRHVSDKLFGIHAQALNLRARRTELLAANLANADTPNYKAGDVDFRSVLGAEGTRGDIALARTHTGHAATGGVGGFDDVTLKYRIPSQPSLDGNTVDEQMEKSEFASNAVRYMASLQSLEKRVAGLIRTLREE